MTARIWQARAAGVVLVLVGSGSLLAGVHDVLESDGSQVAAWSAVVLGGGLLVAGLALLVFKLRGVGE